MPDWRLSVLVGIGRRPSETSHRSLDSHPTCVFRVAASFASAPPGRRRSRQGTQPRRSL